ncbi:MAG: Putative SigmaB asociated two-component system sensor protein, partial [uncultured Gemmatimonadaceae bacterium]
DAGPREAVQCALDELERRGARRARRLAVVQDGSPLDHATLTLLGAGDDVDVVELSPAEAVPELRLHGADCAVLALGPDADWAVELLDRLAQEAGLAEVPLVAYLPEPAPQLQDRLDALAARVNLTTAGSPERLVDATALFLHRAEARLPEPTRRVLAGSRTADEVFRGRKVLVVDDDIRNVFALASTLEQRGMQVVFAENGREGIAKLRAHPDVDLVLLDVMMPEMDGYETARAIRAMERFAALPIISLTAKAMKGDRRKSLDAGASDYITKPVDVDALLSLMRVWLHR